jgi:1-deoxy-D-xylulose-5-phosphate synthase
MGLLETINSPADVKKLELNQLPGLAGEVRRYIIDTIAQTGGHFGGPLGCVEICIALHHVLNSPKDKIVWDVGYQAYAHKILTGRRDQFPTLRQWEGVAPFPRVEESPHDTTNPGHGSTSISAALGYAVARDLRGTDETVVSVIGDGSIVGGLAQEGLHQAGHLGSNLIILLNDNEMGISNNFSSMAKYLQRLRTDSMYLHARNNLEEMLRKLPGGELMLEAGQKVKAGVKTMVLPGMWFEELGLHYLGPINGHSINDMITALKTARAWGGPVLLHVETVKGKGFEKAEAKAGQIKWHAATPADLAPKETSPATAKKVLSYTQIFSDSLIELATKNEKLIAITAAMPGGTGIDKFIEKFPTRGFDVGMIEEHAVTFASGLALGGFHPVVAIYSTFLQRSFDQIIHDVCQVRDGLPVTFALDRGGLVGEDGATHQGVFDLSYLRCIPHMTIMAPRDEDQLRHMLKTSTEMDTPSAIRYPRGSGTGVPIDGAMQTIPIGKGELLRGQEHDEIDLTVVAIGYSVQETLKAADALAAEGARIAVFDARFVKPLDETAICDLARRSKQLMTVEENMIQGGFGSAILELLHRKNILLPVHLVGVPDQFIHHGLPQIQRATLGLDSDGILASMRHLLSSKNGNAEHKKVLLEHS